MSECDRRKFMKISTAGAVGTVLSGISCTGGTDSEDEGNEDWSSPRQINPAIDNLRTVCCSDPAMLLADIPASWQMQGQNDAVDGDKVARNMDLMAISLAQAGSAAQAWSTIFQKPAEKNWSDVKAALKVNCLEPKNVPRLSVVGKICTELISLGVPAGNVTIYDACSLCRKLYADSAGYASAGEQRNLGAVGNPDAAGVKHLQQRWPEPTTAACRPEFEDAGVFQEELALLGEEQSKAGQVDALLIGLDLSEIGVDCEIEGQAVGEAPAQQVNAHFAVAIIVTNIAGDALRYLARTIGLDA